jgi:endonuclease YncB( thermonuclease family)
MSRTPLSSVLCCLSFVFALNTALAGERMLSGRVLRIIDGDTIHFQASKTSPQNVGMGGSNVLKVRMVGIDTPELHLQVRGGTVNQGPLAQAAADALSKLTPVSSQIQLLATGLDNHGRTLGRVYLGKRDINLELVKQGLAYSYIICSGLDCNSTFFERHRVAEYLAACSVAQKAGLGIFNKKTGLDQLPFEFRLQHQGRKPDKWVGDFQTRRYVSPERYDEIEPCNRVFFTAEEEALAQGFQAR